VTSTNAFVLKRMQPKQVFGRASFPVLSYSCLARSKS
jgi:hypothetical protein